MTERQYLLVKLAEEACELGQIALKTAHFGVYEQQFEDGPTNIDRVNDEFNDLLGVLELLRTEHSITDVGMDSDKIVAKMAKLKHYMNLSKSLGEVE